MPEAKDPKLGLILGRNGDLYAATNTAFRSGSYSPAQIQDAIRRRYLSRSLKAARLLPHGGEGPILYYDMDGVRVVENIHAYKEKILGFWTRFQPHRSDHYGVRTLLDSMSVRLRPIQGFCALAGHALIYSPATERSAPKLLYFREQPNVLDHARDVFGIPNSIEAGVFYRTCSSHDRATCWSCHKTYTNVTETVPLEVVLKWRDKGCRECWDKVWLALLKPPKNSPARIRSWSGNAKQYVELL